MFDFLQICLRKAKPVCKIPHMFILADVWLLPNMFGKNQTRWYIYTWVLFSTHVWILTHRYGKRHTCVQKATQLYVLKCLAFSTHVWEKPLTCLFPPELSVRCYFHLWWYFCCCCWWCSGYHFKEIFSGLHRLDAMKFLANLLWPA